MRNNPDIFTPIATAALLLSQPDARGAAESGHREAAEEPDTSVPGSFTVSFRGRTRYACAGGSSMSIFARTIFFVEFFTKGYFRTVMAVMLRYMG